jgi:phage terminase large subunit-like protein
VTQSDRAVAIINKLQHTKGPFAGTTFNLRPWQEQIVRRMFTEREDGLRQYRTCLLMLPRKNGKSELAAALAIYFLLFDGEIGAEVYSAAADKDQAALVFNVAAQMIRLEPEILAQCEIIDSQKRIVHRKSGSIYRAISAEAYCMAPSTLVELEDGQRRQAADICPGDRVIGWNGSSLASGVIRSVETQRPSPMLRITTHRGRSIEVTAEHQFLTMTPGRRPIDQTHQYQWTPARELVVGQRLRVALGDSAYSGPIELSRDSSEVWAFSEEAWALGAWAGDGECGRFRFINTDAEIVERMELWMFGIGSLLVSALSTRQRQRGAVVGSEYPHEHSVIGVGKRRKSPGREWVRRHFGQESRAHTKRIPDVVWKSSPAAWAAFMAGWLDTDGCIPTRAKQVTWCSVSDGLLQDGQALLARMGINACVNECHGLTVNGRAQLQRLAELLGPHMTLQRKRLQLEARGAESRAYGYFAHDCDRIVAIESIGDQSSVSLEVDGIDTHVTNGLITHNSKHGFNASAVIYDELHAAPDERLWDVLSTSQGARGQPWMMAISTAGYDPKSILGKLYNHGCKVRDGLVTDPTFLPIIYEAPKDADWLDERVWHAANPALGDFRSLEDMRILAQRAQSMVDQENTFRRLYLNQWTEQSERWMDMVAWDACRTTIDFEALRGRRCYVGLDLSSRNDLTAAVLVFPDDDDGVTVVPWFWVPADNVESRERKDRVPYGQWIRDGLMHATPGNVVDQGFIREELNRLGREFGVQEIAFDPWNATKIATELMGDGFQVAEIRQGFRSLSEPTKHLGALVAGRKIRHDGHAVLRWNMANMVIRTDPNGNIAPDKAKTVERIDGVVALIMGLGRAIVAEREQVPEYGFYSLGR